LCVFGEPGGEILGALDFRLVAVAVEGSLFDRLLC
jgi:hypothetical protein